MLKSIYDLASELTNSDDLIEVVDQHNQLIAAMPKAQVFAQKLNYRAVIPLFKDNNLRSLFKLANKDTLEIAYIIPVNIGNSASELAQSPFSQLKASPSHECFLGELKITQEHHFFATIMGLTFASSTLNRKVKQDTNLLLLDQVEFQGLISQNFKIGEILKELLNLESVKSFLKTNL